VLVEQRPERIEQRHIGWQRAKAQARRAGIGKRRVALRRLAGQRIGQRRLAVAGLEQQSRIGAFLEPRGVCDGANGSDATASAPTRPSVANARSSFVMMQLAAFRYPLLNLTAVDFRIVLSLPRGNPNFSAGVR
jgi:hypothetical protein